MLSEYNITMDSIGCDAETASARRVDRKTRKALEKWAYVLAARTARVFDCDYYHNEFTGETSFVGVGADPEVCGWMYGYLYKTLLRLASEHMRGPARRLRSAKSKREARNSFLFGAVDVISSRMIAQKKVAPVTSDALVPVKDALIRAAMPDNLKIGTPIKPCESRPQDWLAGMSSAERIPLSTPVTGEAYGLQVAIGVIKEEAPHIRFQSARTLLENIARKIEQKLPEIVSMYMDNTAKAHGWEKKDDKGQP